MEGRRGRPVLLPPDVEVPGDAERGDGVSPPTEERVGVTDEYVGSMTRATRDRFGVVVVYMLSL